MTFTLLTDKLPVKYDIFRSKLYYVNYLLIASCKYKLCSTISALHYRYVEFWNLLSRGFEAKEGN